MKGEDADEGDADADDEVQDYTNALLEGLAEVAVEWLTVALYCHYMERDNLIPHENLLVAAVTGVFVAELNIIEDGEEDDDDEEELTHLKSKTTKTTTSNTPTNPCLDRRGFSLRNFEQGVSRCIPFPFSCTSEYKGTLLNATLPTACSA